MAEKRWMIDSATASHELQIGSADNLLYARSMQLGEDVAITVDDAGILSLVSDVQQETYPLLVIETADEDLEMQAGPAGQLQVRHEDPSYYWSMPDGDNAVANPLTHANTFKDAYISTSTDVVPDGFGEVRVRPEKSILLPPAFVGVGSERTVLAQGLVLYVQLSTAPVPSTMSKISFADGFPTSAPTLAASEPIYALSVRAEGDDYDGKVQVTIENQYTLVENPVVYAPSGRWLKIRKDAEVATMANLSASSVAVRDDATFLYVRLWTDASSVIFATSSSSSAGLAATFKTGGQMDPLQERDVKRLFLNVAPGDSRHFLLTRRASIGNSAYRTVQRSLSTEQSEGNAVPFDASIVPINLGAEDSLASDRGILQVGDDDLYFSDTPTFKLSLTNVPLLEDTVPAADSVALSLDGTVVASATVDGVYVAEYAFSAIGVTLRRNITIATASASEEAATEFGKLLLSGADAEDRATIEGALATLPATMVTPGQKLGFRKSILKAYAASAASAGSERTIASGSIFLADERESVPQAILDKPTLRVRPVSALAAGDDGKTALKEKAAEIAEDFSSSTLPSDLYWPMTEVGDCFAVALSHTDESIGSETVIFRIKAKTSSTVTYAMQKGDEDEIEYAPQNADKVEKITVFLGLMRYFFYLGGAQSDGQQLMEDRTAWQTAIVQKQSMATDWAPASAILDFDIGQETVYHTPMQPDDETGLFAHQAYADPWTGRPVDVSMSGADSIDATVPGSSAITFTRTASNGLALTKVRTVIVPFVVSEFKKIHAVGDVGAMNNQTDLAVNLHDRSVRVSCPTLRLTKAGNSIIIKPSTGSGAASVTLSSPEPDLAAAPGL